MIPDEPARFFFTAPTADAGVRLDRFVTEQLADPLLEEGDGPMPAPLSRAQVQRLIEAGDILVDGAAARPSLRLRGGETITVVVPPPKPLDLTPEPMALDILFEDSHLVAINKPAGLVVHPGAGHGSGTLVHGLLAHCRDLSGIGGQARPGIVHRLDRDTSGVMVVAKNDRSHEGLARQFSQRTAKKHYVAIVLGEPTPGRATIETLIGRHPTDRKRFSSRVGQGRTAITTYSVVAAFGGAAYLDVWLATGRTHQIRVHLADRGHPIAGDPMYGGTRVQRLPKGVVRTLIAGLSRQALHAKELRIEHPVSGAPLVLAASLPPELRTLADAIRPTGRVDGATQGNK